MGIASFSTVIAVVLAAAQPLGQKKPAELLLMISARSRLFDTAMIEWSISKEGKVTHYTSRYAGRDFLLVRHAPDGDPLQQEPAPPFTYSDRYRLLDRDGNQWDYVENNPICHINESSTETIDQQLDVRTLGLTPNIVGYGTRDRVNPETFLDAAYHDGPPDSYTGATQRDDGTVEVAANWRWGRSVRWRVDPDLDWAPVFTELTLPGDDGSLLTMQAYQKYRKFQDRWVPEEIDYYRDDQPWATVSIEYAEFDDPTHPQTLEVAELLPLLPGTSVKRKSLGGWSPEVEIFDGQGVIAYAEYLRRLEVVGDLDITAFLHRLEVHRTNPPGVFPKNCENLYVAVLPLQGLPGRWEVYTRVFIRSHALGEAQTELAWKILKKAQEMAEAHLLAQRAELEQIHKDRLAERESLLANSTDQAYFDGKMALLEKREQAIAAPIDRIFTDVLKAGLNKLLTPRQRELTPSSESSESSAAASRPTPEVDDGRP